VGKGVEDQVMRALSSGGKKDQASSLEQTRARRCNEGRKAIKEKEKGSNASKWRAAETLVGWESMRRERGKGTSVAGVPQREVGERGGTARSS